MTETGVEYTVVSDDSDIYYGTTYWNDIPVVRDEINRRVSGDARHDWIDRFMAATGNHCFARALMLNCGNGHVDRDLITRGVVETTVGIDCSSALLEEASEQARQRGLAATYHCMDVNTAEFPPGPFDLMVNFSAAHHIQRVDRVFRALRDLLDPDGFLVNYDYVGPHRNQYGWASWEAAHSANQGLPEKARQELRYPHLPTMLADDPSEAIHPELVLETMGRYFELEEFTPVGGAVGYVLLTHNARIFGASEVERSKWAAAIMAGDAEYLATHPEDTLFAYWVARPGRAPVADQVELDRWAAEEEAREAAAALAGGEYYPHTSLQSLTLELADQTILAEHRTAWAHDLRAKVESLSAQLEQARNASAVPTAGQGGAARLAEEARRIRRGLGRRVAVLRHRN